MPIARWPGGVTADPRPRRRACPPARSQGLRAAASRQAASSSPASGPGRRPARRPAAGRAVRRPSGPAWPAPARARAARSGGGGLFGNTSPGRSGRPAAASSDARCSDGGEASGRAPAPSVVSGWPAHHRRCLAGLQRAPGGRRRSSARRACATTPLRHRLEQKRCCAPPRPPARSPQPHCRHVAVAADPESELTWIAAAGSAAGCPPFPFPSGVGAGRASPGPAVSWCPAASSAAGAPRHQIGHFSSSAKRRESGHRRP